MENAVREVQKTLLKLEAVRREVVRAPLRGQNREAHRTASEGVKAQAVKMRSLEEDWALLLAESSACLLVANLPPPVLGPPVVPDVVPR